MPRKKGGALRELLIDKPAAKKEYDKYKKSKSAKIAAKASGLDLDDFEEREEFEDAFDLVSESAKLSSSISKLETQTKEDRVKDVQADTDLAAGKVVRNIVSDAVGAAGNTLSSVVSEEDLNKGISDANSMEELASNIDSSVNRLGEGQKAFLDEDGKVQLTLSPVKLKELEDKAAREATATATAQAKSAALKETGKIGRDYLRVSTVLDRTMDSAFKFNTEQLDKFGTKPGQYLGLVDKLTPDQWNKYKAGWIGAGREGAATMGRFLIPGARGINMTVVFAKSTAEIGNTVEGNAFNLSNSMGNTFGTALANNIMTLDNNGKPVHIQDVTIDKATGLPLSRLPIAQRIRAVNDLTTEHVNLTEKHYLTQAFLRDPRILQNKTIVKLTEEAPEYKSWSAVDTAVDTGEIPPGTLVKVNGEIGAAR